MSDNSELRPQFWVLRPGTNAMVPLIALDELPPTITIRGVPRSLDATDLTGMTCAGQTESRHRTYLVEMPNETTATQGTTAPFVNNSSLSNSHGNLNDSVFATPSYAMQENTHNPHIYPQPIRAYGTNEQMPSSASPFATASTAPLRTDRAAHAPGFEPLPAWKDTTGVRMRTTPGRKTHCSYWLRHGECDYAQQGCLYLHEMPLDPAELDRLGHSDIPKWYQEKYGVLSFKAASADHADEENTTERSSPRTSSSRTQGNWRSGMQRRGSGDECRNSGLERRSNGLERRSSGVERRRSGHERREDRSRNGNRRSPPRSSTRSSLAIRGGRGPGSRSAASASTGLTASSSANGNTHHQSLLASEADKKTLAAIEADEYAKSRELEEAKRLIKYDQSPPTKYRLAESTPESSGGEEESADFEYSSK